MANDFTIIMAVRHRFGAAPDTWGGGAEPDANAPFVGLAAEFPFSCPGIDSSQAAILQFQYRGSTQMTDFPDPSSPSLIGTSPEYPVKVNGRELAGGVPAAPVTGPDKLPLWSTRLLLIDPGVLGEANVLRIEATSETWNTMNVVGSNFTIDNVVVFFKTTTSPRVQPTGASPRT